MNKKWRIPEENIRAWFPPLEHSTLNQFSFRKYLIRECQRYFKKPPPPYTVILSFVASWVGSILSSETRQYEYIRYYTPSTKLLVHSAVNCNTLTEDIGAFSGECTRCTGSDLDTLRLGCSLISNLYRHHFTLII